MGILKSKKKLILSNNMKYVLILVLVCLFTVTFIVAEQKQNGVTDDEEFESEDEINIADEDQQDDAVKGDNEDEGKEHSREKRDANPWGSRRRFFSNWRRRTVNFQRRRS